MFRKREDKLFEEYRKARDPRALADAFDRTAPEIWRVALHLTRDRCRAEDALQETFLAAIEKAEEWDARRPLLPWLLGIMVNRVRAQRRANARSVDPERLRRERAQDPNEAIESRELEVALERALDEVPAPYGETLRARLLDEESAASIARREGIPPGTVRMRIRRGLELLRKRLPRSYALLVIAASASLSHVRAQVLASAQRALPATATTQLSASLASTTVLKSTLGGWMMWKFASVGVALALAILFVATRFGDAPDAVPDLEPARGVDATLAVDARAKSTPAKKPVAGERVAEGAQLRSEYRIRLIDPILERAVPFAELEIATGEGAGESRDKSVVYATGISGTLRARSRSSSIRVKVREPFRAERESYDFELVPGALQEFEIRLAATMEVKVRVVGPTGLAVQGAEVIGWKAPHHNWGWDVIGRTDARGEFVARTVEPSITLAARAAGWAPTKYRSLQASTGAKQTLSLRLSKPGATLEGRVLDESGEAVAGARVAIQRCVRMAQRIHVWTDERGRFVSHSVPLGANFVVAVFEEERALRDAPVEHFGVAKKSAWKRVVIEDEGARDVELRVPRGAVVYGQLRGV